jgi:hypothetical protein
MNYDEIHKKIDDLLYAQNKMSLSIFHLIELIDVLINYLEKHSDEIKSRTN